VNNRVEIVWEEFVFVSDMLYAVFVSDMLCAVFVSDTLCAVFVSDTCMLFAGRGTCGPGEGGDPRDPRHHSAMHPQRQHPAVGHLAVDKY
jgi:hypothetical protein